MQCSALSQAPCEILQMAPDGFKEQVCRSQHLPDPHLAPGVKVQVRGSQQVQVGPQSHSSPSSTTQLPQVGPILLVGGLVLKQLSNPSATAFASPALLQLDQD